MTGPEPATAVFTGTEGNRLVGDVYGDKGPVVLLLHGGGQTRHAWGDTARRLARAGWVAYALDQRGHGDSEWVASGNYDFRDFGDDAAVVADALARTYGSRPVVIGASLGGVAGLLSEGKAEQAGRGSVYSALVLVDVTPRVDRGGVDKIQEFMRANAVHGFDSIVQAADSVAGYLPHRPKPRSLDGLKKNLRLHPDGRWRWHWDPKFMDGARAVGNNPALIEALLIEAARIIRIPALLVRGAFSELVQEAHVKEFLELVPHAQSIDVAGARHMVAGDRNDAFSHVILDFLANAGAAGPRGEGVGGQKPESAESVAPRT